MIEILSSKRMIFVIIILIIVCAIIVIIEEWFTNSQLVIASTLSRGTSLKDGTNDSSHNQRPISLSGPKFHRTNWHNFLTFLSSTSLFGAIFGLLVRYRQHQLRTISLSRFRKQADFRESKHTLIDMSHTS